MSFLTGEGMTGGYGGADIIRDCTIEAERGEVAVIVGPNGAGKSTAMKAVFGMIVLRKGTVRLDDEDITRLSPQERVRKGMGFVPQERNVFTTMTVRKTWRWAPTSATSVWPTPWRGSSTSSRS